KIAGHLESIREDEEEHIVYASPGINNTAQCMELTTMQCPTPALIVNPSCHDDFICSDSSAESFVTDDDDNSNMSEEEDEEYFIFAGRGSVRCHGCFLISIYA
ncbi:hypothetical protein EJB05_29310, partial [Eragrostis curvula]